MIIICPNCKSGFRVADNTITENGCVIKCSKCGHAWQQTLKGVDTSKKITLPIPTTQAPLATPIAPAQKAAPIKKESKNQAPPAPKFSMDAFISESGLDTPINMNLSDEIERLLNLLEDRDELIQSGAALEEISSMPLNKDKPHDHNHTSTTEHLSKESSGALTPTKATLTPELAVPAELSGINLSTEQSHIGYHNILKTKHLRVSIKLIIFILLLISGSICWFGRFPISKKSATVEAFYNYFGVTTRVLGEGLDIKNIKLELTKNKQDKMVLTIKGLIVNNDYKGKLIPLLRLELIDSKGNILAKQNQTFSNKVLLTKDSDEFFTFNIENPPKDADKTIVTFAKAEEASPFNQDISLLIEALSSKEKLLELKTRLFAFGKTLFDITKEQAQEYMEKTDGKTEPLKSNKETDKESDIEKKSSPKEE